MPCTARMVPSGSTPDWARTSPVSSTCRVRWPSTVAIGTRRLQAGSQPGRGTEAETAGRVAGAAGILTRRSPAWRC
ncbi:hypothetical protein ACFFX0_05900 [Citricoccus parietis]|uniref:Uncharacterized protein n=1 Tax=Citricoccus parietis TaxID=592307 RepID=A0ABV5FVP6_9MICC